LSGTIEHKIKVTVSLTPRTEIALRSEANRLRLSFGDVMRRVTDKWADEWEHGKEKPPEKVLVLDRDRGELRRAR